jgi:hypothetical protein
MSSPDRGALRRSLLSAEDLRALQRARPVRVYERGMAEPSYEQFVKKLAFLEGFTPPTELRYEDVVATAITRSHVQDDMVGISRPRTTPSLSSSETCDTGTTSAHDDRSRRSALAFRLRPRVSSP